MRSPTTLREVGTGQHEAEFPFEYIARELRNSIARGARGEKLRPGERLPPMPPGSRLPPLPDLVAIFDRNVTTVRRALAVLADEGLIIIRPGLGTWVARK